MNARAPPASIAAVTKPECDEMRLIQAAGEGPGDAARHDAVARRDPEADARFVYSVRTTGVYCLPSCPSRPARRENVGFHADAAQAEAAGFRPCRRCRPDRPRGVHPHRDAVVAACRLIESLIETGDPMPPLAGLAAASGLSPPHFHRIFRAVSGVTPRRYAASVRSTRLRLGLADAGTVTEALYDAGFNASSRFYAEADGMLGMTPQRWRQGGKGETIRFAAGTCTLGEILVAASTRGVCAVELGDDADQLVRALQDRFSGAVLMPGDEAFERQVAGVVASIEAGTAGADLPLDIRGTAFQHRVWQALRAIPSGETVSYTGLAARIGLPDAVRAVAGACAANRIAVLIPCHRIVRGDGTPSGYRWGVARKQALLRREAADDPALVPGGH